MQSRTVACDVQIFTARRIFKDNQVKSYKAIWGILSWWFRDGCGREQQQLFQELHNNLLCSSSQQMTHFWNSDLSVPAHGSKTLKMQLLWNFSHYLRQSAIKIKGRQCKFRFLRQWPWGKKGSDLVGFLKYPSHKKSNFTNLTIGNYQKSKQMVGMKLQKNQQKPC